MNGWIDGVKHDTPIQSFSHVFFFFFKGFHSPSCAFINASTIDLNINDAFQFLASPSPPAAHLLASTLAHCDQPT